MIVLISIFIETSRSLANTSSLATIKPIIPWLPPNTQSLIVVKGIFKIPNRGEHVDFNIIKEVCQITGNGWRVFPYTVHENYQSWCTTCADFENLSSRKLFDLFRTFDVFLSAKIILKYLPDDFANNPSMPLQERACYLTFFRSTPEKSAQFVKVLQSCSSRTIKSGRYQIFECVPDWVKNGTELEKRLQLHRKQYETHLKSQGRFVELSKLEPLEVHKAYRPVYISIPKPGTIIMSRGDLVSLKQVLSSNSIPASQKPFLSIPEWSSVNKDSSVFGIRHFPYAGKLDPTSPLSIGLDSKAVGFVLNLKQNSIEYTYLSTGDDLAAIYPVLFPARDKTGGDYDLQTDGKVTFNKNTILMTVGFNTKAGVLSFLRANFWLGEIKR